MPDRTLITEKDVLEALQKGLSELVCPPAAIITPLASDTAREKGLALVRSSSPSEASSPPASTSAPVRTVTIGSDHGGFGYKETLKPFLRELGYRVLDLGTDSEASCDYPDFAYAVARAVAMGKAERGIMIDGAGLGSAMVCNKVAGIRAACAYNSFTAWNARAHNNANALTLGSRTLGIEVCKRIVEIFLKTEFEGGRHQRRVGKIGDVEQRRG